MRLKGESLFFIGIIVVSVIVVALGVVFLSGDQTKEVETSNLIRSDNQIKGPENAKVTIVEFADFQCPACGAEFPILKEIEAEYKGKIKFVFRHFPLPIHKNARPAAEAAEAAGEQGKFWEYHDILYQRQKDWAEEGEPRKFFEAYAEELDLNLDKFNQALDDQKFANKIEQGVSDGKATGVNATPTLFLNGEKLIGVQTKEMLKQKIDSILSNQ